MTTSRGADGAHAREWAARRPAWPPGMSAGQRSPVSVRRSAFADPRRGEAEDPLGVAPAYLVFLFWSQVRHLLLDDLAHVREDAVGVRVVHLGHHGLHGDARADQ